MSKSYLAALAAACVLTISAVPAAYSAEVSKASAKTLAAAQEAMQAKRFPDAISKAEETLRGSDKTPYDAYVAYNILTYSYQMQGNKAKMLDSLRGMLDSGYPSAAEQNKIVSNMFGVALETKNYAQAVELGNRVLKSGAATPETYDLMAYALEQQGKQAEAGKLLEDYVKDVERTGQKPRERTLSALRALQDKQGNKAGAMDSIEKLVRYYPKADYWNLLTYELSRGPKMTDRQRLHVYRLKVATGTLKQCRDFTEMADIASAAGMPGEAQKTIDQGLASKACTVKTDEDRLRRQQGAIARVVAEDKAKLAKLEADARTASTGEPDVSVGAQYFGNGEYPKAIESLSRGVGKGGLKNSADAQLTLAIAQYRGGNKAEALKTLRAIKADDPTTKRIVELWMLYIQ